MQSPRSPSPSFQRAYGFWAMVPAALVGCSLFTSKPEPPRPRERFGTFHALSDSETPTGFAMTRSQLWVGTNRGLLRYDEGVEAPVRLRMTDGLPGEEILALGANADTLWVATNGGLAKLAAGMVEPHISDYPFVGRIRALTVEPDGRLWVGGSEGLARFSGDEWTKWTERYDVLQVVVSDDGAWIATQDNGVALLKESILHEHGVSGGLPAAFIRNVVPREDGKALVLAQSSEGSSIGYLSDDHWYTYTLATNEPLVALIAVDGEPTIVTPTRSLRLVFEGDTDPDSRLVVAGIGPEMEPRQFRVSPAQHAGEPGPMPEGTRVRAPARPIPLPRESVGDAPTIGYEAKPLAISAPVVQACGSGRSILLGTIGLGVIRLEADAQSMYRTRDLVLTDRAFTVGSDAQGNSYILTRDGRAARFDGERLTIVDVTDDPTMRIVAFTTGGTGGGMTAYALAHAPDTAWWRIFEQRGGRWTLHLDRELQTAEGVEDVTFFGVDPEGDFWLGLEVQLGERVAQRGVVVMSPSRPDVVFHHSAADPAQDGQGAKRIPDTLSAVAFDPAGGVWFAGLDGAVKVTADEVKVYGESQGLQGGVVGDIDFGPGGIPYVATHGGVGRFEGGRWLFESDLRVRRHHPIALAVDGEGRIWAGGNHGLLVSIDGHWRVVDRSDGLLAEEVSSIVVDGANRVWFVTPDGISLLTPL